MSKKLQKKSHRGVGPSQTTEDLLKDLLIVQLRKAGLDRDTIRSIVGVDVYRVQRITKHLKSKGGVEED